MFPREKTVRAGNKTYRYLQIVENKREDGRVRQRVLCSLGNKETLDPAAIDRLVVGLARYGTLLAVPRPTSAAEGSDHDPGVGSRDDRHYGDLYVLDRVWRDLGLQQLFRSAAGDRRFHHDLERATFAMVANRLIDPASKLRVETWLDTQAYLPLDEPLTADHFYKTLQWLHAAKDELEVDIHQLLKRRKLTSATIYYYDTTLTHFEGAGPPGLAQVAGRKGKRPGKQHVLVGLVTTSDGWPVMYHLFPGASNDSPSFKQVLQQLYQRFGLREIVIICDRGMQSDEVFKLLEEKDGYDYRYIIATRLRKAKEVNEEVLTRAGRYRQVEEGLEVKEVWVEDRRYVVCRSKEAAERDQKRRAEILDQLEAKVGEGLSPTSKLAMQLQTSGNKRFLVVRHGKLKINRSAVTRDQRYDGKWVLRTNLRELDPAKIALRYKAESRIERSILTIKDFVGLRPVYHHHEEWVSGHVFVCVLALLLFRGLQERLGLWPANRESVEEVLRELGRIRAKEYRVGREDEAPQYFWARSDLTPEQRDLLERLKVRKLPRTLAEPPRLDDKTRERTRSRRQRRHKEPRPAEPTDCEVLR